MINRRITIAFFLISAIIIAGCVGNGDINTSIEKWNKIADKTQEIRLLEEQSIKTTTIDNVIIDSELAKDTPNFNTILPLLDKKQKTLDEEIRLLEEASSLISEFAGSTVNLGGDAKNYADSVLSNLRAAHRYWTSSVDNNNRAIESLKMNYKTYDVKYYRQYEQFLNLAESDRKTNNIFMDKASDSIKKLEALQ
jgi:hypothetical protein